MLITAHADASWDARHRIGGWGVVLWRGLGREPDRIERSGRCPPYVSNSTNAEFAAIVMAIHIAWTEWSATSMVGHSDCRSAIELATEIQSEHLEPGVQVLTMRLRWKLRHGITLRCEWVRGHALDKDDKNCTADRLAKEGRAAAMLPEEILFW